MSLTIRVVFSIAVSGFAACALNTEFFDILANGSPPKLLASVSIQGGVRAKYQSWHRQDARGAHPVKDTVLPVRDEPEHPDTTDGRTKFTVDVVVRDSIGNLPKHQILATGHDS